MTNRAEVQSLQPGPMNIYIIELTYSNDGKDCLFSQTIEEIKRYVRQIETIKSLKKLNDDTLLESSLSYDEYVYWVNRLPFTPNGIAQIVEYNIYQVENPKLCTIIL